MLNSLFWMDDADIRGALNLCPCEDLEDEFALIRAEKLPAKPIEFKYLMGGKPRDLIATGYSGLHLYSDRFINLLRANEFTGWTTYPVELYGKRGERIEGYHGFAVTGRCGPIDDSQSDLLWRPPPVPEGNYYKARMGIYFDPDTWDGSDIFVPKTTGFTFVVEAVKEVVERAKLKNIRFKEVTEIERLVS